MIRSNKALFQVGIVNSQWSDLTAQKSAEAEIENKKISSLVSRKENNITRLNWKDMKYYNPVVLNEKNWICVEKGDAFKIRIAKILKDYETYGCSLYIDGQYIRGKRTMGKFLMFQGFKMGNMQYKEFLFSVPGVSLNEDQAKNSESEKVEKSQNSEIESQIDPKILHKYSEKRGCIIVEWYKTESFQKKIRGGPPNRAQKGGFKIQKINKDVILAPSVKKFNQDLLVKEGKVFQITNDEWKKKELKKRIWNSEQFHSQFTNKRQNKSTIKQRAALAQGPPFQPKEGSLIRFEKQTPSICHKGPKGFLEEIEFETVTKFLWDQGPIDSLEINYANWGYLQLHHRVDVRTYEHIKLAPQCLIESSEFLRKCIQTIVHKFEKVAWQNLEEEFKKATNYTYQISDLWEFTKNDLKGFIEMHNKFFDIDDDGFVTLAKNEEKAKIIVEIE